MSETKEKIIYTKVDEAPALATYSFLPILRKFAETAGVTVETRDISLAGRITANFPDHLTDEQRIPDDLKELGQLVKRPEANIIKLPCISASIPQLKAAVKELQEKGYDIPPYPDEPKNEEEEKIKARFDVVKGSAVNPVLRMGNADRRVPTPVKNYARKNPYPVSEWRTDSRSHVAHMKTGDFRSSEKSTTISEETAGNARIEFVDRSGKTETLKDNLPLIDSEIIDAAVMRKKALRVFLEEQVKDAREKDVLFSVHLKATMMKVSDPIIFGHVVSVYFKEVFEKHAETFKELGIDPNSGLGDLYAQIKELTEDKQREIKADIDSCYERGPKLAMVDSEKGITNLHVPSDVIIDASMPYTIRNSAQMWGPDGKLHDTKFVIPDDSYAGLYKGVVDFCKLNGPFDPSTMGTVQNVGLMAQKAEEYGSHDKTFEIGDSGTVRVVSESGRILLEQPVERGDIFRMCQAKDLPVQDWVKLAVNRAMTTGFPVIFWLDSDRPHDAQLIKKVERYLKDHDTSGLDIKIMPLHKATLHTCELVKQGKNVIAVTGNVLRDYLTDLFPILEVGTSARMLSIVPLMNGGGLFETGAGGSAPKHVQQFRKEGHLRWDSLGEFLALAPSLVHLGKRTDNEKALILAETLDKAIEQYLENNRSPSRVVGEPDTRCSHFYLTMYWVQALSEQTTDMELQRRFSKLAKLLADGESKILDEMLSVQGKPVNYKGYYKPDHELASEAMRPSETFNAAIDTF